MTGPPPEFKAEIIPPGGDKEKQAASRVALKMNRRAKVAEDAAKAADVWREAVTSIGLPEDDAAMSTTTDGIARAADLVVAASLASILSGDPQFAPQHGKEAAEMMKAAASVAREYRARLQLERLQAEVTGNKGRTGGAAGSLAGTITELVTKLEARANGETRP